MLTSFIALSLMSKVTLNPTDDIWVYQHAPDQTADEYIRCWAVSGKPFDVTDGNVAGSWSCLKFDIRKLPANKKLLSAKLTLTASADANYIHEDTKKGPLQVRAVTNVFEEENFNFGMAAKVVPSSDKKDIFAVVSPEPPGNQEDFPVEIDLLKDKSAFANYLAKQKAETRQELSLALTSLLDPSATEEGSIYKFYSRNADKKKQPVLMLEFED